MMGFSLSRFIGVGKGLGHFKDRESVSSHIQSGGASFYMQPEPSLKHVKVDTSKTKHLNDIDSCMQHQNKTETHTKPINIPVFPHPSKQTFYPLPKITSTSVRCFS